MNIAVQQRVFAFSSKYEIETPASIYEARKRFFFVWHKIKLFAPHSRLLATIRGHYFFRPKYKIELSEGQIYHFSCERFWKGVFVCQNSEESFRLYQHKGLNYSIFRNDSQIAAFSRNRVKLGRTDRYEIRMNSDANLTLVICMALVVDCGEIEDDSAGTVTIDLGSLGPEERQFDKSWQPS
ncbi:MAG TPA: hypothetical protein VGR55_07045 [Candidatus Acidoferrum sp.]|nr:hypothetical protein [Candidatus Acidoferrum sp.]